MNGVLNLNDKNYVTSLEITKENKTGIDRFQDCCKGWSWNWFLFKLLLIKDVMVISSFKAQTKIRLVWLFKIALKKYSPGWMDQWVEREGNCIIKVIQNGAKGKIS